MERLQVSPDDVTVEGGINAGKSDVKSSHVRFAEFTSYVKYFYNIRQRSTQQILPKIKTIM
jgi:hypothetical protein